MSKFTERFTQRNTRTRILLAAGAALALIAVVGGVLLAGNPPLLQRLRGSLPGEATWGCFRPYAICTGEDLSDIDATGQDLTGVDFTDSWLSTEKGPWKATTFLDNTNLTNATLVRTDLRGVSLTRANLTGANLTGANLANANLTGAILFRTTMPDGTLGYANTDDIPSAPPPGGTEGVYQVRPRHVDNMCLSGSALFYTRIWQCSNQADDKNQRWTFVPADNFYQVKIGTSGWCLTVENAALTAGATVIASACQDASNANQLWRLDAKGDGGYWLINKNSGLCAAPRDGGKANDTVTVQLPCTSDPARLWGLHMQ